MTTPAPHPQIRSLSFAWFSTGRGSARSNIQSIRSNRANILHRSTHSTSLLMAASPSANAAVRLGRHQRHSRAIKSP